MNVGPVPAAALLGALCLVWQPASAQHRVRVAQNVQYVICAPKPGAVGRCIVQEPVDPCPAPSAEAFPKKHFATVHEACTQAKKLQECGGGLSGC